MRPGEACRLARGDVDLEAGTIVIEDSKFGKSRLAFLGPTAVTALRGYARARDEAFPEAGTFLVNSCGRPLTGSYLPHVFAPLAAAAGIQAPPGQRAPRLHDLRHVFAVATLLDWYRDGGDVQARLPVLSTWLGHVDPKSTYWYLQAVPGEKEASPNTVAEYRDTCKLLLAFAQDKTGKEPSGLSLADLGTLVGAFLHHLEEQRGNGSATRNARLAAIHSLFRYAAPRTPEHAAVISQVLAIPPRRRERAIVSYLTPEEADALVAAPGRTTWHGRRDHALLLLAVQTGLRVSELTGLARQDIHLGAGPGKRPAIRKRANPRRRPGCSRT